MTAIDQTDKASIKCDLVGGNARGYTNKYRAQVQGGGFLIDDSLLADW